MIRTGTLGSGALSHTSKAGAKKPMVIRPFREKPKLPEDFVSTTLERLREAVVAIFARNASKLSKEELYRAVEDLCLQKFAQKTYELLSNVLREEVSREVAAMQSAVLASVDNDTFFAAVDRLCVYHFEQLGLIRNIFLYLDRCYSLVNGLLSIWDLGNKVFRECLVTIDGLLSKIVIQLVHRIDLIRAGDASQVESVARITKMLSTVGLYEAFERPFLDASIQFFTKEGTNLHNILDDPNNFWIHADRRLIEAFEMGTRYLEFSTRKPLMTVIENHLLAPNVASLLERGFSQLVQNLRIEDLRRIYLLCERVNAHATLRSFWNDCVRSAGEKIVEGITNGVAKPGAPLTEAIATQEAAAAATSGDKTNIVEEVIKLQDHMKRILEQAFFDEESFRVALQSSFEYFLNIQQIATIDAVTKYVDRQLRGEKGITDMEVEANLKASMVVFRYLGDKDVFEAYYKKLLAKRLLHSKSSSTDLERTMIALLKAESGSNFTSKLEGMFSDVWLSQQCQSSFVSAVQAGTVPSVTGLSQPLDTLLSVQVLTMGHWPQQPVVQVILPTEFATIKEVYQTYYTNSYQGRRLQWAHSLDRVLLAVRIPGGPRKELDISLLQAVVLWQFMNKDTVSFRELHNATGIELEELKRIMQSLACGHPETRILSKEPRGRDIDPEIDQFNFNGDIKNRKLRIKIPTIQAKESPLEVSRTMDEVFREREHQVDAVIVRIMKARKTLQHGLLLNEVTSQLRFQATIASIRQRIESLIERDYLERDSEDTTCYNYLA